jgi:hypothetical protein
MLDANLFEQLLATYPAEKRELARQIYDRFADGDTTQFFTQLFVVLGLYTHYVEDMPQAVIEANKNARAGLLKVREEIGLLAQAIDKRNLNITNHATRTEELCRETQEKCDEITDRLDAVLKNVGDHIDTEAIVSGVQDALETGIDEKIISPFVKRSTELAREVVPTLAEIQEAAAKAAELWPKRIWKMALTCAAIVTVSVTILGIGISYWRMKKHFDSKLADEIRLEKYSLQANKDAFQYLAAAGVAVHVARSADARGYIIPNLYCLYLANAQIADMNDGNGRIFFASSRSESELKQLLDIQQQR